MGAPFIVSVGVERPPPGGGRLREWEDAYSAHIGQVDRRLRGQEVVSCLSMDERPFYGRIECSALGEILLCKLAATKYRFTHSLTTPTPTLPIPIMLVSVTEGSGKFVQCGHSCILTAADWTVIDTKQPLEWTVTSPKIKGFIITLPRPSDAAIVALVQRAAACRLNSRSGLSRVLHTMMTEGLDETSRLPKFSERILGAAITTMTWEALREQEEMPRMAGRRNEVPMRLNAYIEAQLDDPELSVEQIAHANGISVRALYRYFAEASVGSVSSYIWQRRLLRCAEALRDLDQEHRSITDICFSSGFSSSSHFCRLFKKRFGIPPARYRFESACRVIQDN